MPKATQKTIVQKKHKFQYSPAKINLALNAIAEGMPVSTASTNFNVPRTTLRNKISGKSPRDSTGKCGFYSFLGKDLEQSLVQWVLDCAKMGFPIDKDGLLTSVQKIVTELNIKAPFPNNRPGKKWYYAFLARHKELSQKKPEYIHGGRGAVTEEKIRSWFTEVNQYLESVQALDVLEDPERIFNMDESGFPLAPKSGVVLGPRGTHVYDERTSSDKENVTTLFAVSAVGKFAPPLTLFKYDRLPKFISQSAPKGWGLGKSESGWMTAECFFEYFSNVFYDYLQTQEVKFPVVVFVDGHRSHLTLHLSKFCREKKIILVALTPNATHIMQPLDVAVFGPLKKKWQHISRKFKIANQGQEITKQNVPSVLSDIINDSKMSDNIKSGFRATGLFPFNANSVDYSKIILRKSDLLQTNSVQLNEEIKSHLTYLEQNIDPELLAEFKMTKRRNHDWEGNQEALCLFKVWERISGESEITIQENNKEHFIENNQAIIDSPSTPGISLDPSLDHSENEDVENEQPNTSENIINGENQDIDIEQPSTSACSLNNTDAAKINSVKRNITFSSNSSDISDVLKSILPYPGEKKSKKSAARKAQSAPCSVLVSDVWCQFEEDRERIKARKLLEKEERKRIRQLKKIEVQEKIKTKKGIKKVKRDNDVPQNDTSSEEEWEESGSSDEDIDYSEADVPDIEIHKADDLKPGDFILVRFAGTGKRMSTTYRYVATVSAIVSDSELQIQCLKSIDKQKTKFDYIENDISTVNKSDILGLLPEPSLEQEGRKLITKFSGSINVFEK